MGPWRPGDQLCLQAARLQGLFPFPECEERMPLVAGQLGSWRRWAGAPERATSAAPSLVGQACPARAEPLPHHLSPTAQPN